MALKEIEQFTASMYTIMTLNSYIELSFQRVDFAFVIKVVSLYLIVFFALHHVHWPNIKMTAKLKSYKLIIVRSRINLGKSKYINLAIYICQVAFSSSTAPIYIADKGNTIFIIFVSEERRS